VLFSINVSISRSSLDPMASTVLQIGWIQLFNVPEPAKNIEAVTLIAELAGEVMVVDEVFLIKDGPVRVKLRAREIASIKGFLEIFIEGVGFEIKVLPETKDKVVRPKDPSPPPKNPDDRDSSEEDDDADDLSDFESKVNRAMGEPPAQSGTKAPATGKSAATKQRPLQGGEPGDELPEKRAAELQEHEQVLEIMPLDIYDPTAKVLDHSLGIYGQLSQESDKSSVETPKGLEHAAAPPSGHFLIHTEGGGLSFLPKDKWPTLQLEQSGGTGGISFSFQPYRGWN